MSCSISNSLDNANTTRNNKLDLVYSVVKRGEIYLCNFRFFNNIESDSELLVIIIQNDLGNLLSPNTIVIPCSTSKESRIPTHLRFKLSSENMIDFDATKITNLNLVILAESIQSIEKKFLRKYIGTLKPEFMQKINNLVCSTLSLTSKTKKQKQSKCNNHILLNDKQLRLLSFIDNAVLNSITHSNFSIEVKTYKILELYGFDFKKNGVQYLFMAIISSLQYEHYNLEMLAKNISKYANIDKEEIMRLIIARVKESVCFKNASTIDFIRLVNVLLINPAILSS